jgi:hypothetical protein
MPGLRPIGGLVGRKPKPCPPGAYRCISAGTGSGLVNYIDLMIAPRPGCDVDQQAGGILRSSGEGPAADSPDRQRNTNRGIFS